jgi:hypothetical protein
VTLDSKCDCGHQHWHETCAVCQCDNNVREERQGRVRRLVTERGMSLRAAYNVVDAAMSGVGCISIQYRLLPAAQTI